MNAFNPVSDSPESLLGGPSPFERERERIHRQMLSVVSHDLKTPLSSIIGSLEIYERVKDKLSEEKQKTLISVALSEARRLDSFITNILEVAKLENGMIKVQSKPTNIGLLLENCVQGIGNRLPQGGSIEVAPSPQAVEAVIDPLLLNRAVNLVLDNAIKFGGAPPLIHIRFGAGQDGRTFIEIRDNGQGIPEAKLDTTISRYVQLTKEDQHPACTGLGLVICHGLMQLLKGEVSVGNHSDGGAAFTLRF